MDQSDCAEISREEKNFYGRISHQSSGSEELTFSELGMATVDLVEEKKRKNACLAYQNQSLSLNQISRTAKDGCFDCCLQLRLIRLCLWDRVFLKQKEVFCWRFLIG